MTWLIENLTGAVGTATGAEGVVLEMDHSGDNPRSNSVLLHT